MRDFKGLEVWRRSHILTLKIYELTRRFPKEELFGLTSQLRRATSSIPTNIAEGAGRGSDKDFARFIQIAIGSNSEVEYQLILTKDLGYIQQVDYDLLCNEVVEIRKMLISFIKKLIGDQK